MVAPIARTSPLNCRLQNASVMTAASGPPRDSSSGVNSRPSDARAPSTSKNPGDTRYAAAYSAVPFTPTLVSLPV
jgi:hypothetical protein